ncbi:MAG: hypothetical protein Q9172_006730 [Xanthocarpia lactea]
MRFIAFSVLLFSGVLASEPVSPTSALNGAPVPAVLILQTSPPQPQIPYLELRHLDIDRRQIQPAAVGAPAQVAAGAAQQPNGGAAAPAAAPKAPVANPVAPVAQAPTAAPIAPTTAPTPADPAVPATAPAAPAAPAAPVPPAQGVVPVNSGLATALTVAPPPKSGSIGLGTLTGKVGVVKTQEAKSEAGLATNSGFGFVASWPSAFKVGASVLLGTAVGIGILL